VAEQAGITPMILTSTVMALVLAWWADLLPVRPAGFLALERR
jgi:hypothetical protein